MAFMPLATISIMKLGSAGPLDQEDAGGSAFA
jgi:hypothetical protein